MAGTRVVVVCNGSLLTSGVESLLRSSHEVDVLSVRDEGPLYERVRAIAPDVIVVELDHDGGGEVSIDRLLRENPRARVITLGLERLGLEVYRSERVEHAGKADLLATISAEIRGCIDSPGGDAPARRPAGPGTGGEHQRET